MLTIKKDLRSKFIAARDQGQRPTCLAFAMSDAHGAERPQHRCLSADYLYYHALRRMPINHGDNGVGLDQVRIALQHDGQPIESDWPYSPTLPADLDKWIPRAGLAVLFAKATPESVSVDSVFAGLDRDKPLVLILKLSERFYHADGTGMLPIYSPDPDLPASHAVVAVAYGVFAAHRYVLVRNSWGTGWGDQGHAWLPEDYLARHLASITALQAES